MKSPSKTVLRVSTAKAFEKKVLNRAVFSVGTPERNTVCKRCPDGFFSNETSSKAPCRKHTNCSASGLLRTQIGNATHDNVCAGNSEATHGCGIGNYLSNNRATSGHLLSQTHIFPVLNFNQLFSSKAVLWAHC